MKDYMHDPVFLRALDNDRNKIVYAKLISLTRDEQPIESIEGVVQSGSINIDGSSAVRRSCSLTMTTKNLNINEVYWGFTTKVKIEIGLQNRIDSSYPDIIWFRQGVFVLTSFRTSSAVNNYTITLEGKDKMCLLNGDISGHFNTEIDLKEEDFLSTGNIVTGSSDATITTTVKTIKQNIQAMMHLYAHEPWRNIVINNIEDYGLNLLDNHSQNIFYLWRNTTTGRYEYLTKYVATATYGNVTIPAYLRCENNGGPDITITDNMTQVQIAQAEYGARFPIAASDFSRLQSDTFGFINGLEEDANGLISNNKLETITINNQKYHVFKINSMGPAGYERTDLVYDKELIAGVGDTITSVLDKLVKFLGPFEYFYNLDGQFVFQAKQTYFNSTWKAAEVLDTVHGISYVDPLLVANSVAYQFENNVLITSLQNNPNLLNVRNDFTIWGKRKNSTTGDEIPIHARYAIDKKPLFYYSLKEQELYMTQECVDRLASISQIESIEQYRKHPVPTCFGLTAAERNKWWHIQDWADYYKAITGNLPQGSIGTYSSATSTGFTGRLHFTAIPVEGEDGYLQVGPGYHTSNAPFAIVDVEKIPGTNDYQLADYRGLSATGQVQFYSHNSLMHRFHGCGHNYQYFLNLLNSGYESYFYEPVLKAEIGDMSESANDKATWARQLVGLYGETGDKHSKVVDWRELIYLMAKDWFAATENNDDDLELAIMQANYRYSDLLGIQDYYKGTTGYEQYYLDIQGFWRQLYDPTAANQTVMNVSTAGNNIQYDANGWNIYVTLDPTQLPFWLDFYDTDMAAIEKYSVQAIGSRTKVVNDDDVRVIIYPDVPDVIYESMDTTNEFSLSSWNSGYSSLDIGLDDEQNNRIVSLNFSPSFRGKSCKETLDNLLYNHSHTNDTLSLTTIPIYYLQPNSIVHIHDTISNIDDYYEINKITLPLAYNGMMNISATKIPQQIY